MNHTVLAHYQHTIHQNVSQLVESFAGVVNADAPSVDAMGTQLIAKVSAIASHIKLDATTHVARLGNSLNLHKNRVTHFARINDDNTTKQAQIVELSTQRNALQTQLVGMQQTVQATQTELAEKQARLNQLTILQNNLETQLSDFQARSTVEQNTNAQEQAQLRAQIETKQTQMDQLIQQKNNLATQLVDLQVQLTAAEITSIELRVQLRAETEAKQTQIDQLSSEKNGLAEQFADLQIRFTATESTNTTQQEQLRREIEVIDLIKEYSHFLNTNNPIETGQLQQKIANLIQKNLIESIKISGNSALKSAIDLYIQCLSVVNTVANEVTIKQTQIETFSTQKSHLDAQIVNLQQRIKSMQGLLNATQVELRNKETELDHLNNQRNELRLELEQLNKHSLLQQTQIEILSIQKSSSDTQRLDLQQRIESIQELLSTNQVELRNKETELDHLNDERNELRLELEQLNKHSLLQQTQIDMLFSQNFTLNAQITDLQQRISDLKQFKTNAEEVQNANAQERAQLRTDIEARDTRMDNLIEEKHALAFRLNQLKLTTKKAEHGKVQERIHLLEKIRIINARINRLIIEKNVLKSKLIQFQKSRKIKLKRINRLIVQNQEQQSQIDTFGTQKFILDAKIVELQKRTIVLQHSYLDMQTKLTDKQIQVDHLSSDNDLLRFKIAEFKTAENTSNDLPGLPNVKLISSFRLSLGSPSSGAWIGKRPRKITTEEIQIIIQCMDDYLKKWKKEWTKKSNILEKKNEELQNLVNILANPSISSEDKATIISPEPIHSTIQQKMPTLKSAFQYIENLSNSKLLKLADKKLTEDPDIKSLNFMLEIKELLLSRSIDPHKVQEMIGGADHLS